MYALGVITTKKSLVQLEKLSTASFCRRRLAVVLVRVKMSETLREACTFVEQVSVYLACVCCTTFSSTCVGYSSACTKLLVCILWSMLGPRAGWSRDGNRPSISRNAEHGGFCDVGRYQQDQKEGESITPGSIWCQFCHCVCSILMLSRIKTGCVVVHRFKNSTISWMTTICSVRSSVLLANVAKVCFPKAIQNNPGMWFCSLRHWFNSNTWIVYHVEYRKKEKLSR